MHRLRKDQGTSTRLGRMARRGLGLSVLGIGGFSVLGIGGFRVLGIGGFSVLGIGGFSVLGIGGFRVGGGAPPGVWCVGGLSC